MEIVKSLIEWGVGIDRQFLIYGGGLWGALLVKQLCALEKLQEKMVCSPQERNKRQSPLKQFFSLLQGTMIHRDCKLSSDFREFLEDLVELARHTHMPGEVIDSPRTRLQNSEDSGEDEPVPASTYPTPTLLKRIWTHEICLQI
jgi:hypothetical protein